MQSALYQGWVRHRRHAPRPHDFRYPLFMVLVDLDELPEAFDALPGWSARRFAPAWFRRADHFGDPTQPLRQTVEALLRQSLGRAPARGPIRLLTHLRYFGYCFNPISCYYCYDEAGALDAVVAEVSNTFGQRHCYVLDTAGGERRAHGWWRWHTSKDLHVSPFMPIDQDYEWRFLEPGSRLSLHMASHQRGHGEDAAGAAGAAPATATTTPAKPLFDASLTLERHALDASTARRVLLQYPLMTLQVIGGIHFEALKLWLKRTPLFPDPHVGRRKETPEIRS